MAVGCDAKVLGSIYIGDNVRIGAGSVVLRDVPSNCTVVGVPGRIVEQSGIWRDPLAHDQLPDVIVGKVQALVERIEMLEQQLFEPTRSLQSNVARSLRSGAMLPLLSKQSHSDC